MRGGLHDRTDKLGSRILIGALRSFCVLENGRVLVLSEHLYTNEVWHMYRCGGQVRTDVSAVTPCGVCADRPGALDVSGVVVAARHDLELDCVTCTETRPAHRVGGVPNRAMVTGRHLPPGFHARRRRTCRPQTRRRRESRRPQEPHASGAARHHARPGVRAQLRQHQPA